MTQEMRKLVESMEERLAEEGVVLPGEVARALVLIAGGLRLDV